jgi:ubiquinone/menaquinone biosynthesis C-methylase UbiE
VFWASGAAMFLRVEALREAGLLDEIFYAHMEEIDLSWRLKLLGYKIFCVPNSVVYHIGGQTPLENVYYLKVRNNVIVLLKNYSLLYLIWRLPIRIILDLLSMILYLLQEEDGRKKSFSVVKAYVWSLKNFRRILISRKQCQPKRRLSDNLLEESIMQKSVAIQCYLMNRKYFWQMGGLPHPLSYYMVTMMEKNKHPQQKPNSRKYYGKYMKMLHCNLTNVSSFNVIKDLLRMDDPVLDVGCGIGYLSRLFKNYIGVDTNIFALKIAKEHFHNCDWILASATMLPFKDKCFKYAISYDCIEHICDVKSFLLEMTRVSEKSIIGSVDFGSWYKIITKTIRHDPTHFFELPCDQLVKLIGKYVKIDRILLTCGIFSLPRRLNRFLARYFPEYLLVMISDMVEEKAVSYKVSC